MDASNQVTQAWRSHRLYLVNLAYQMLADIGEAEDVAQETFLRLARTDHSDINDVRGWSTGIWLYRNNPNSRAFLAQPAWSAAQQRCGHRNVDSAAIAFAAASVLNFTHNESVTETAERLGVPVSWQVPLGLLLAAGSLGLITGFVVPVLGTAAACGLVVYFLCAAGAHIRARDTRLLSWINWFAFFSLAVAALVVGLVYPSRMWRVARRSRCSRDPPMVILDRFVYYSFHAEARASLHRWSARRRAGDGADRRCAVGQD